MFAVLPPDGVFLFDVAAPGRNVGHEVRHQFHDQAAWLLGLHATEVDQTLDRRIVILIRELDGRYRRVDEHHVLVLYPVADVEILERIGFTVETRAAYTEPTTSTPASGWAVVAATKPS